MPRSSTTTAISQAGATVTSSGPLIYDPETFTYKLSFKIKGPDGAGFGL